jgi:hypothetical protein
MEINLHAYSPPWPWLNILREKNEVELGFAALARTIPRLPSRSLWVGACDLRAAGWTPGHSAMRLDRCPLLDHQLLTEQEGFDSDAMAMLALSWPGST